MSPTTKRQFQVLFDVHQCPFSAADEQALRADLDGLARQVEHFPIADLHVLIEGNRRSNDVSVKLSLILPGTTLVTNDHDPALHPAFERALASLIDSLQEYKGRLGQVPERQKTEKGTYQELLPSVVIDGTAVATAVEAGDYSVFRTATFPYEEGLRKLVGRWVRRYPELEAQLGQGLQIADIVEEVFLMAFEGYEQRPRDVPFGDWLQSLMDPAVKALLAHPDEELENIHLAQTARAAEQGATTV